MTSPYIIKNIENPKIRYFVTSGFKAWTDLCDMYGFEPPDFFEFMSTLEANRQDVIRFYARLDEFGANPFKK